LKYLDDILIFGGITAIVTATFLLHKIAGIYALGAAMLALGIWFARNPIGKG
jgi:intracellular septation protein A